MDLNLESSSSGLWFILILVAIFLLLFGGGILGQSKTEE